MMSNKQGNQAKYLSYKLAIGRMQMAIDAGFPLEAVAIAESLMSDRLMSYANHHGADLDPDKCTLGKAAKKASAISSRERDEVGQKLATNASEWARKRNAVLHGIAKSAQGTGPKLEAHTFVEYAQEVAVSGRLLVKQINAWSQKLIRQSGKKSLA